MHCLTLKVCLVTWEIQDSIKNYTLNCTWLSWSIIIFFTQLALILFQAKKKKIIYGVSFDSKFRNYRKLKIFMHTYNSGRWQNLSFIRNLNQNFLLYLPKSLGTYNFSYSFLQRLFWKLIISYFPMKKYIWHSLSPQTPLLNH